MYMMYQVCTQYILRHLRKAEKLETPANNYGDQSFFLSQYTGKVTPTSIYFCNNITFIGSKYPTNILLNCANNITGEGQCFCFQSKLSILFGYFEPINIVFCYKRSLLGQWDLSLPFRPLVSQFYCSFFAVILFSKL